MNYMNFAEELTSLLPGDIPCRPELITKAALHLERIVEANQSFNLTRIVSTREAVIKHVLDSVLPWKLFAGATHILDAGTGAGFPGVPLAIVLPHVHFILSESVGKKARFVETAVAALGLPNVEVKAMRAEEILQKLHRAASSKLILTGRAVAPVSKVATLFAASLRPKNTRALFYKGPALHDELAEAAPILKRHKLHCAILETYELPDHLGSRSILEVVAE